MRARHLLALALCAVLTAASGCGDGGGEEDGTVTLEFLSLAWQKESVAANKAVVRAWNEANPGVRVKYVQGDWANVQGQLLTSFEGGVAPDVFHNDAANLTDFAYGGWLADLTELLPEELKADIPARTWGATTFDGGVYGVPFLQEPRMLIANTRLLEAAGVRVPTVERPWTWAEFEQAAKDLTDAGTGTYGVVWAMKEPVAQSVNLSLSTGGSVFYREDGKDVVRYGARDSAVAETVERQVGTDRTAPESGLGMSGSDTLPGFFAGRYAMVPLNFSARQQIDQQAPDGFEWTVLPMPAGAGGPAQGVVPQTLSVSYESPHRQEAADFVAFMARAEHQVELARGDWLLPTSRTALKDPALTAGGLGWPAGAAVAAHLEPSPVLGVRGYLEWKDRLATPAFQNYYRGADDLGTLRRKIQDDGNRLLERYQD